MQLYLVRHQGDLERPLYINRGRIQT